MNDPCALGLRAIRVALDDGTLSAAELMAATLERIERFNATHNAIVSLRPREALLAEAQRADRERAEGKHSGPLHGVPQAVKDLAETAGIRTTYGSPLFAAHVPDTDSILAERLKRAGAIIIGKTNTPEFGLGSHTFNPVFGVTRNAYDPARSAGGSSGGAAVAVALGMLAACDGSDMMGSLRNPAAFNNVIGVRPSHGVVPKDGPELFQNGFAVDGPMARSVEDAALLLSVLAGPDPRDPTCRMLDPAGFAKPLEAPKPSRIGWLGDLAGHLAVEPGVTAACAAALETFPGLGHVVEEARVSFDLDRLWDAWLTLRSALIAGSLGPLADAADRRARMKPELLWEIDRGSALRAREIHAASSTRSRWYLTLQRLFERYDALVLPAAQLLPFEATCPWPSEIAGRRMDTYHRWMEVTIGPTLAGCPVAALPAGFAPDGRPAGFQLIGRPGGDLDLLRLAHAYDAATCWPARVPPSP